MANKRRVFVDLEVLAKNGWPRERLEKALDNVELDERTWRRILEEKHVSWATVLKLSRLTDIQAESLVKSSEPLTVLDEITDSLAKIEKTTSLRRLGSSRILRKTADALSLLGNRHRESLDEPRFYGRVQDSIFDSVIPGTSLYALCGRKNYGSPYVRNYFKANFQFVEKLHAAEKGVKAFTRRTRLTRIFIDRPDANDEDDEQETRKLHWNNANIGVLALVIPASRFTDIDEIQPGLRRRMVDDGLGFLLRYSPPYSEHPSSEPLWPRKTSILHVSENGSRVLRVTDFGGNPLIFDELLELFADIQRLAQPISSGVIG